MGLFSLMQTPLARAVRDRMIVLGMNSKNLSRAAGLGETYVRDILEGRSKNPKHEQLAKLADALDTTLAELLPPSPKKMSSQVHLEGVRSSQSQSGIWSTPITEIDVYAGMGAGGTPDVQRALGEWQMPTEWLRQEVRGDLVNLKVITVEGDSMADTLRPGDKVIVDLNRRVPSPPGIFVLWDGIAMVAKRLEYLEGSEPPTARISSDNGRYAPYERTLDEMNIVGRIMGRWQRLS